MNRKSFFGHLAMVVGAIFSMKEDGDEMEGVYAPVSPEKIIQVDCDPDVVDLTNENFWDLV